MVSQPETPERPARVCRALLCALDAAEGRRRSRKRDQRPDAIGLELKRELLVRAVEDDPAPDAFEEWLMGYARERDGAFGGAVTAMARAVLEEWRLAQTMDDFAAWLEQGAPSDDAAQRAPGTP